MSDNEDYFSGDDYESSSDDEKKIPSNLKNNVKNTIESLLNDNDDDDDEGDEIDEDDDVEIEEEQTGGAFHGIDFGSEDSENEDESDDDDESENENMDPSSVVPSKSKKTPKITIDPVLDDDEDYDDDEDDDDENYLQKFDNEISKNYITETHPECAINNYDEILLPKIYLGI
jgi:hypothetical protein